MKTYPKRGGARLGTPELRAFSQELAAALQEMVSVGSPAWPEGKVHPKPGLLLRNSDFSCHSPETILFSSLFVVLLLLLLL